MTKSKKRIMIVDDAPLMRLMIKTLVENDPALEVVAVAKDGKDGKDAPRAASQCQA